MTTDPQADQLRLKQNGAIDQLSAIPKLHDLVTVYLNDRGELHNRGIFSAFIPSDSVEESLEKIEWDFSIGQGSPGAIEFYSGDTSRTEYFRYGNDEGIEPLVIVREFHGLRQQYLEISEEFRLFHNLYHDTKSQRLIRFDEAGNEIVVGIVEPNVVKLRLLELRQFAAMHDMSIALFFDLVESSSLDLNELSLDEEFTEEHFQKHAYGINFATYRGFTELKSFSRLLGKRFFDALPKDRSGFAGFDTSGGKSHESYVVGSDDSGNEISHSSDPQELSNYFGANPDAPHYLTPVFFRKTVLDKYYQQPGRYRVEAGQLWCGGLWSLTIDNHLDDVVVAWLGDLGRDLPHQEQIHWRSFNVPPVGETSSVFYRQQILAEWADTAHPEHLFKHEYGQLIAQSETRTGWPLFLPLAPEDQHFFASLRIPVTEEQRAFDDAILSLTKILIDSINEKGLNGLIPIEHREDLKGSISRLTKALELVGATGFETHIQSLRDLQELRSSGVAHRKGKSYQKLAKKLNFEERTLPSVFRHQVERSLELVRYLSSVLGEGKFGG